MHKLRTVCVALCQCVGFKNATKQFAATRMGWFGSVTFLFMTNFVIFKEGISWAYSRLDAGADSWKNKIAGMAILKNPGDGQKFSSLFRVNKSIDSYALVHFPHTSDHARAHGRALIGAALRGQFSSDKVVQWLPWQPLIPSIDGWNRRADYIGLRLSKLPPSLMQFWCIIIIIIIAYTNLL